MRRVWVCRGIGFGLSVLLPSRVSGKIVTDKRNLPQIPFVKPVGIKCLYVGLLCNY